MLTKEDITEIKQLFGENNEILLQKLTWELIRNSKKAYTNIERASKIEKRPQCDHHLL